MKTLKIVGQRLQANLIDKEAALDIDAHLLRQRRDPHDLIINGVLQNMYTFNKY